MSSTTNPAFAVSIFHSSNSRRGVRATARIIEVRTGRVIHRAIAKDECGRYVEARRAAASMAAAWIASR